MSTAPTPPPLSQSPTPTKRKSSRTKWIVIIAVIVVAAVGIGAAIKAKKARAEVITITTAKAETKTITQVVTATGKIQPQKEVKISPEVSGEIIELPIKEGQSVKKGDLLVRLKPDNFQFQVEQQEASLASAKASLIDSKSRLDKALEDYKRTESVYKTQFLSEQDMTTSRTARDSANASFVSAEANVRRAEGSLSQAKDNLSKTTIVSPIDGRISLLNNQLGERITGTGGYGSNEVMRVADLEHMEIRVKVNENDIVNVKVGNAAIINIDAFPGRKFNGTVNEIGNSAQGPAGGGGQGSDDVSNFQVKIGITDRGVELKPGMSATADIQTQTVENVVTVPIQSVTVRSGEGMTSEEMQAASAKAAKEKSGKDVDAAQEKSQVRRDRDQRQQVVFIKQGDTVKLQRVESGIADNTSIEIKSGVTAGAEIVSGSYAAISRLLKDGSKVTIEVPKPATKK